MSIESVSLRFVGGKSNKVYNMQIDEEGSGFMVYAQNGRYGGTLTPRKLTKEPVPIEVARKVYQKKLQEQLSEGYKIEGESTSFSTTIDIGIDSGNVPQLLNMIEEQELDYYINSDAWMAEEKKDGHHIMVEVSKDGEVKGSNKRGKVIPISSVIASDCKLLLPEGGVIDGEAIGDAFWVFDLLKMNGLDIASRGAEERHSGLVTLFGMTPPKQKMELVGAFFGAANKRDLVNRLREQRREGVVFKRRDSIYTPGRPNSYGDMVKFKFKGRATCLVTGVHPTKRSVQISVMEGKTLRAVGNVTIPPNHQIPKALQLIDVEYLYAYREGAIYQSVYIGIRTDQEGPDQYETLKFKAEDE